MSEGDEFSPPPSVSMLRTTGNGRKRTTNDSFLEKLGKHMDTVGKALSEPVASGPSERFLQYLDGILAAVPPEKRRKCEQDLLLIANNYADGKCNIQLVEIED